jgi:hypothetical protein
MFHVASDQVPHAYKVTCKLIVLYTLIFAFMDILQGNITFGIAVFMSIYRGYTLETDNGLSVVTMAIIM